MNEWQLAMRTIKRLENKDSRKFELPKPTDEQLIEYFDSLRIPEFMESTANHEGTGGNWDKQRQRYKEKLALLLQLYECGDLSLEDYTRLTTVQNYDGTYHLEMRRRVNRWRPEDFAVAAGGIQVFIITNKNGDTIFLTFEDHEWIAHADFPYMNGKRELYKGTL